MCTRVTGPRIQLPAETTQQRSRTEHTTGGPPAAPTSPATPEQPTAPAGSPPEGIPSEDNQTRVYDSSTEIETPDGGAQFPSSPELTPMNQRYFNAAQTLLLNGTIPDPDPQNTAQFLAETLGFQSKDMMLHHLRHLPTPEKQQLLNNLQNLLTPGSLPDHSIRQAFEGAFRQNINNLAAQHGAPPPTFNTVSSEGAQNLWDTASLASVYNSLMSIEQQNPERLATTLRRPGNTPTGEQRPLVFVRSENPPSTSNPDQFLHVMTDATMIAHTNNDRTAIHLYNAAITGDQTAVTQHIVGKLELITRLDPGNNGRDLLPVYTPAELQARELGPLPNETEAQHAVRLRNQIQNEWSTRFGGPENLQKAMNFVIRYKGLHNPEVVSPPFAPVRVNGQANDPNTLRQLNRMGVNNLQMLMARMEQQDAVGQLQSFLAENAPPGSPMASLNMDGLIGRETQAAVKTFETSLVLNTLKERVEDDPSLPETRKVELLEFLNEQFQELANNPNQTRQILQRASLRIENLLAENPQQIAAHTATNLRTDLNNMQSLATGQFDRQTAETLVAGWFNVMDSGQGVDLAEQLITHEMGHLWEEQLNQETPLEIDKNWERFFTQAETIEGFSTSQMNTNDYHDRLRDDRTAASDYSAGSATEDFAESSRMFTYDPQRLMRRSLMKFMVMNALDNNRYNPTQIMEMARECGYTESDVLNRLDSVLGRGENGIQFTLPMSQMLNETYAPLRSQLTSPPVAHGINFFGDAPMTLTAPDFTLPTTALSRKSDPLSTLLNWPGEFNLGTRSSGGTAGDLPYLRLTEPEVGGRAVGSDTPPPPASHESGYVFNHLSDRYRELYQQLERPGISPAECQQIRAQIQTLSSQFLGAEDTTLDLPPEASTALNNSLAHHGLGQSETTPAAQKALVAALSIFRATGQFERSEHPELAEHLHPGFDLLLQNPQFQQAMADGTAEQYHANHLFESSLDLAQRAINNFGDIETKFNSLAGHNARLRTALAPVLAAITTTTSAAGMGGAPGAMGQIMSNTAVQDILAQQPRARMLINVNQAIQAMNQITGSRLPPMTIEQLNQVLIRGALSGESQPDYGALVMAQLEQGRHG